MSRQQMSFELDYGASEGKTKCKSCQGKVDADDFMIGVKSESMYDPMWYHFHCFWTRCWYRKQMNRHLHDYEELIGFTKLTAEDKERFKEALDDMTGGSDGSNTGLKRRSLSDENLLDAANKKKSKSEAVELPKLALSATGILSKSSSNLAASGQAVNCSPNQEEIAVSKHTAVTVRNTSTGTSLTITSTAEGNDSPAATFDMNPEQWRMLTSVFTDVTDATTSVKESDEQEFSLLHSQVIRVMRRDNGVYITLGVAVDEAKNTGSQLKDVTFHPEEWQKLVEQAATIEACITRVSN